MNRHTISMNKKLPLAVTLCLFMVQVGCGSDMDGARSSAFALMDSARPLNQDDFSRIHSTRYGVSSATEGMFFIPKTVDIGIPSQGPVRAACASTTADMESCQDDFVLDQTRGLYLVTSYQGITSTHQQRLELYSPDNNLYDVFVTDFEADQDPYLVVSLLRIRGTAIQAYHMTGEWTSLVFLDGSEVGTFSFNLL